MKVKIKTLHRVLINALLRNSYIYFKYTLNKYMYFASFITSFAFVISTWVELVSIYIYAPEITPESSVNGVEHCYNYTLLWVS